MRVPWNRISKPRLYGIGRLIAAIWVLVIWSLCFWTPATAAPGPTSVLVVMHGQYSNGLSFFHITYINDTKMQLDWGYDGEGVAVMIRAKYEDYPDSPPDEFTAPSDGYLVYQGSGTSCFDVSMDFDMNPGPLYYSAWAQKADGTWFVTPLTDEEESRKVTLLVLAGLALGLTVAMFATREMLLGFPCVIFWGILAGYSYQQSSTLWDWQYLLFFGSIGMAIFCSIAMYALRKKDLAGSDADEGKYYDEEGDPFRRDPWMKEGPYIDEMGGRRRSYYPDVRRAQKPMTRSEALHQRVQQRRAGAVQRRQKDEWGEFK